MRTVSAWSSAWCATAMRAAPTVSGDRGQERIPHLAGRFFGRQPVAPRIARHILGADRGRQSPRLGSCPNIFGVRIRLRAPQPVIQVRDVEAQSQAGRQLAEHVQQAQ